MKLAAFIHSLVLIVGVALSSATTVWAQRAVTVTVTGNQITGTGSASVMLASQGDENALGFSITFDPAILRYNSVANGTDSVGATVNVNASQATSGRVGVALALPAGSKYTAGNRELVKLNFTVLRLVSGSTTLGFGNTPIRQEVSSDLAKTLPSTFTGLTITATLR